MSKFNQSQAPYYGEIKDNNYKQLLFKPGMHVQAAELNELQLMTKKATKDIADCVLKDGDIRSGLQIIIEGKEVLVTDGKVYLEGLIRDFTSQKVTIVGEGLEKIGLVIDSEPIDHSSDKDLLSPAAGSKNYGLPGADRLKEVVRLTVNDDGATTIFLIENGVLVNDKVNEDGTLIERFNSTLARRTYDESGHYKVWGLELSQKKQYDEDFLYLSLSEGKAYVEGWEIDKQTATTIPIKRSKNTRTIYSEPKVYEQRTNRYLLNNFPVSRINRLTSLISVSTVLTRQGSINGSDPIPSQYSPVVDIQSITQVSSDVTYKKNTDFILEGDTVRWLSGGEQPDLGSTYNITFTYNKQMVQGVDYKLTVDLGSYYVELLTSGDKPVENSQMQIDYDFFLHYVCSITLDKDGLVRVIEGQPDVLNKVAPPNISDQSVLLLGYVRVSPMDDVLSIENSRTLRSSMERIQRIYERLEEMEINQAITDLDKEALEGEEASLLKGIFTDGFLGFTKSDVNHSEYNAAIDPINQILTVGYDRTTTPLQIDKGNSAESSSSSRLTTSKATEVLEDQQPYATESHLINPYTVFPAIPSIKIQPAVDNWIDTNSIVLQKDGGTIVKQSNIIYDTNGRVRNSNVTSNRNWASNGTKIIDQKSSTTTSSQIVDSAVEFMRPITITLESENFRPYQDNIRILFNDILVTPTPDSPTYKGANGSLKADSLGNVKATFKVPNNIQCGTVDVKVYCEAYPEQIGSTPFTANGVLKTKVTTHTTVKTVYRARVYKYVDPVGQTFSFPEDKVLSSLGLFFSNVDPKENTIVQIRETVNGYPSDVVLAEKVLAPSEVIKSEDSSAETKVTFDDPVYLKKDVQYSFTVLSNSEIASIFVQDLGKKDLLSSAVVMKNPYIPGVMFSSSNALTWTSHQTKNIKFNLYCNNYIEESIIYFNSISNINFDRITLLADTSVPVDTDLVWEYTTDGGKNWLPLVVNQDLEMIRSIDNLTIRAKIRAKKNVSPTIALDSLILSGSKNKEESNYVSRNVHTDMAFTTVKIIADVYAPSGTGVVFYYATDIDGKVWKPLQQSGEGKVKVVGGYIEYTYTAETTSAKDFRVKAVLTTNNSAVIPMVKNLKCIMK